MTAPLKVILIDDEPLARTIVREYLASYPQVSIVEECGDGFEGVKAIAKHQPDLIFLDIQMPKITGFEMLELLEQPPAIIFTTAFDEFAIRAFETHAVDYLLKPFGQERFNKAMAKFLANRTKALPADLTEEVQSPDVRARVVVKKGTNIVVIPTPRIFYFEAFDDYVKIHTVEGFYLKKKTLSSFEKSLDATQFVRVHRSYLMNLQELVRIEPLDKENHEALLKSGVRIPLSQSGYAKLKSVLGI